MPLAWIPLGGKPAKMLHGRHGKSTNVPISCAPARIFVEQPDLGGNITKRASSTSETERKEGNNEEMRPTPKWRSLGERVAKLKDAESIVLNREGDLIEEA